MVTQVFQQDSGSLVVSWQFPLLVAILDHDWSDGAGHRYGKRIFDKSRGGEQ